MGQIPIEKQPGIIIQARMTSTRLPGKVLLPSNGIPFLEHQLRRLRESGISVFLATTVNATDDPLVEFAQEQNIPFFRGDEDNVLSRYYLCAKEYGIDPVIRVTSDCPLIDSSLIRKGLEEYQDAADENLYVSNVLERTYPRGFDFEVFSFRNLEEAFQNAELPSQLEHVTPYINRNVSGEVRFQHITRKADASKFRLTLDTEDDRKLLATLIEMFGCADMTGEEIISIMEENPHLHAINEHIEQKKV